jgi:hypothetical protein
VDILAAREFQALQARYRGSVATPSDDPNGRVEEGLPPGEERAGVRKIGGTTADVILIRVDDPITEKSGWCRATRLRRFHSFTPK